MDENGYTSNLWVYDLQKKSSYQLTGLGKERSFNWLNGDEILFAATRNPKDQERQKKGEDLTIFYSIDIRGGEALEAFRVPMQVQALEPLGGSEFLLTCTYNPQRQNLSSVSEETKAAELKRREEEKDYEVLEEIPYWSNGKGFTSKSRSRLYIYNRDDNTLEPLTGEVLQVTSVELNCDKTQAVIVGAEYTGMMPITNSLYIADLPAKTVRKLTPDEEFSYSSAHFVDDQKIICR
ncbi:MAG TPA: S9 family peptidase, partial [Firmicutes bacterium]|nr:S9 family peptidase [Bacillota bacterium]